MRGGGTAEGNCEIDKIVKKVMIGRTGKGCD